MKLKPKNVDVCYPFVIQSGGDYDLRWTAGSNDRSLVYDPVGIIVCQLGCRYKSYCSNVGRTYLIDPPRAVSEAYAALLAAHSAALGALREGVRCSDVYAAAAAALAAAPGGEALLPNLTKALGSATGLEFRETSLMLSPKCDAVLVPGMVFNVATGLADLVNPSAAEGARDRLYALLLADTAAVSPKGAAAEVCTSAKSALSDISYEINEQARRAAPFPAASCMCGHRPDAKQNMPCLSVPIHRLMRRTTMRPGYPRARQPAAPRCWTPRCALARRAPRRRRGARLRRMSWRQRRTPRR